MARVPDIRRAPLKRTPYTRTTAGAAAPCVAGGLVSRIPYLAIYLPWGGAQAYFSQSIEPVAIFAVAIIREGGGGGWGGEGGRALWVARTVALGLESGPLPLGITRA